MLNQWFGSLLQSFNLLPFLAKVSPLLCLPARLHGTTGNALRWPVIVPSCADPPAALLPDSVMCPMASLNTHLLLLQCIVMLFTELCTSVTLVHRST